ncbi:glycosyltransferase family 4 protein [Ruminiclostridium cellobioparum]|jgi:glycosyltransferase involved in cell wall biosynthesis|uniref:glycosyltransferase family 4 protein n=1 Tax=Ruminiclostridium cellobioparum TaxID=29355 RepID=UPI0028AEED00|nr:glycosyltransferase family 4 protein [Ruminiclostridium cellobioparum]
MKKILQCITLSEAGGAQQVVKHLCEGLYKENKIILATSPNGELVKSMRNLGIKVYPLCNMKRNISPVDDFKTFIQLIHIIRYEKPDIVHCHSWKAGVLGRIAAFFCGVEKIYFTVHGWSIFSKPNKILRAMFICIEKILGLITTKLIFVCDKDRQLGISLNIAPKEKLCTIYNGINDIKKIKSKRIREIYKIPEDAIILCSVARMALQKRCFETVSIMAEIMKKRKDIYFIFVGDGPLFKQVKNTIEQYGIEQRFILTGSQNNVPDYLYSTDIFLLLSNYEGLPISLLEAMCMGIPLVASNVGGVCELIEESSNGFLVSNDEKEIIYKLNILIEDDKKREEFGKRGRAIFEYKFKLENMLKKHQELYK